MIVLGKKQILTAVRTSDFGMYLGCSEASSEEVVLLPRKEVPATLEVGDSLEVFIYKDTEDRIVATTITPKVMIDTLAELKVVALTPIGAFLDWGLDKDLFIPFKQQTKKLKVGDTCLVGVYVDKSERLCGTMKIYELLSSQSPYSQNQTVKGRVYAIKEEMGTLIAVEDKYHGMIPEKEMGYKQYQIGDLIEARIKRIREDGKLELSLRKQAFQQIEEDARLIMEQLDKNNGKLALHDKSTPQQIKATLNMSKASFKRAVGRLLKEGALTLKEDGIYKNW